MLTDAELWEEAKKFIASVADNHGTSRLAVWSGEFSSEDKQKFVDNVCSIIAKLESNNHVV